MSLIPKNRTSILPWTLVAALSLLFSLALVDNWEARQFSAETENRLFLQGYAYAETSSEKSPRKIFQREGTAIAEYRVKNFNRDLIQIEFSVPVDQLEEYSKGYGYSQDDLSTLAQWQKKELKDAYQYVVDHSLTQADLNRMGADIKNEYHQKVQDLMASRGFKYKRKGVLTTDIPGIVKRNIHYLSPVALDINTLAEAENYDALDVIGATLSLMQTGLEYENIPLRKQEKITGGIYPPLVAMTEGKGDCDTKTALMASILLNWEKAKLIGVGIPNHYLIGVLRTPAKGDAYVEYDGLTYVLMEPAGPGRFPPGMISDYTLDVLNAGDQVALEPLRKN